MKIFSTLTQSERRVLDCMAQGFQSKAIAEQLYVSVHTVKNHKTHICEKLNLNVRDLYLFAIKNALLLQNEGGVNIF